MRNEDRHIIEVENLVKKFGDLTAVNDISFFVREGEIFGFLGPNGAGKTTTINILCTLMRPTSGRATLNGFDVVRQQNQVRRSIGVVFQDPSLDIALTGIQNLYIHAYAYGVPPSVRKQRIEEVLRLVDLSDVGNKTVRDYSGGMRRRLEVARGLLHFPKVLFLDEPTLGLDPQTRHALWDYLLNVRKREGITLFLTTHYMDEALVADRIAIIDYGKIVALDTPDALKRMIGGDIISLKTEEAEAAMAEIRNQFGLDVQRDREGVFFEVPNGEEFIPLLMNNLKTKLHSISVRRPTLDDVFLKLTGHDIRGEEGGDAAMRRQWAMHSARDRGRR